MQDRWEKEYLNSMDELHFSEETKERMKETITSRIRSENGGMKMKKFSARKTAVLAAACVLVFGVTAAFAGGEIRTLLGSSPAAPEWTSFEELPTAEQKAGFDMEAADTLEAFSFVSANVVDQTGLDENGQAVNQWKELMLTYQDQDGRQVFLAGDPAEWAPGELGEDPQEIRTINGIPVYYAQDEYLFVKDRSEATAEEIQRESSDAHFFISEDGDGRSTVYYQSITFEKEGVRYHLFSEDVVEEEDLFAMTKVLIGE